MPPAAQMAGIHTRSVKYASTLLLIGYGDFVNELQ